MKEKLAKWWKFFDRKLIQPLTRHHNDPRYMARATSIGMGSAFIPFTVQMPIVFGIWVVARKFKWRFSLMVGLAWTFLSNTFTNLPLMYAFYLTGEWMRDKQSKLTYLQIKAMFDDGIFSGVKDLVSEFGASIFLGSVPFIIFFSFFGYVFGYYMSIKYQRKIVAE